MRSLELLARRRSGRHPASHRRQAHFGPCSRRPAPALAGRPRCAPPGALSPPAATGAPAPPAAAPGAAAASATAPPPPRPSPSPRDMSATLSLADVRSALIRQEDTIIFNLIERAQFARNDPVYRSDAIPVPAFAPDGRRYSLLEYVLRETEQLHGKVRRYTTPLEHPFYPDDVPALVLPPMLYPSELAPCAVAINVNDDVMAAYLNTILPGITAPGDDNNHGSAATLDILALQALSTRIHYGKFVAEAKFRARPADYEHLIRAGDAQGLMDLLTDVEVEKKVVERVRLKAATFGQDISAAGSGGGEALQPSATYKVAPDALAAIYNDVVMPLTKDVQVMYLLRRLD